MAYGVTNTGFVLKRLPEIKAEIEQEIRNIFGEVNLAPTSVFGQLVGVFSKPCADVWEALEAIYQAAYPNSAEGVSLDHVVSINGLSRRPATSTIAIALCNAAEGTTLPVDTRFRVESTGEDFVVTAATTITKTNALEARIEITGSILVGHAYTVTIDGVDYPYTAVSGDTKQIVITSLVSTINGLQTAVDAIDNGDETLSLIVTDFSLLTAFSVDVDAQLNFTEIWSPVECSSVNTGRILAVAGTLDTIVTPVAGLVSVKNITDGSLGALIESDLALRERRRQSFQIAGAGTLASIRARVLEAFSYITDAAIFENRSSLSTPSGMPPHSFELVCEGVTTGSLTQYQEIAELIWLVKPAGIETHGNIESTVLDSAGNYQDVRFSTPTAVYVHLRIRVTPLSGEPEAFPADGLETIAENLYAYGDALQLGHDIIFQRWYGAIYLTGGIASVVVDHAITASPLDTPDWSTYAGVNIPINQRESVRMDSTLIDVDFA